MLTTVDPNICHPNKFQPPTRREFTPDQLADLASIGEIGFIHTPIGFKEDGTYMIIVGWRRRCAWMIYHPGEPMPLELRDKPATDADLYRLTVVENESRENFNAIQKAELATQAIELGMTQAQAGALFNPPIGQAAVSHLLSLRKLPPEIKSLVESGAIPERIARQLVTPARHALIKTIQTAQKIANVKEDEKDRVCSDSLFELYRSAGICLDRSWLTPWVHIGSNGKVIGLDWPDKPINVPDAKSDKGEPSEIPACTDCPFNVQYSNLKYCMRPACHNLKNKLWNEKKKANEAKAGAKAARKSTASSNGSIVNGTARLKADREKERAKREQEEAAARPLLAAAVELISAKLSDPPEPYLSFLLEECQDAAFDDDNAPQWMQQLLKLDRHALAKLKPTKKARFVKALIICERVWGWSDRAADVRTNVVKLAAEWKIKLPKSWDTISADKQPAPTNKKGK